MANLWGPINPSSWHGVPFVSGRRATEADVQQGKAVFYVDGPSEPHDMNLPSMGLQRMEDGREVTVVIIQAELGPSGPILGVRYLEGGNGVCNLSEVRFES